MPRLAGSPELKGERHNEPMREPPVDRSGTRAGSSPCARGERLLGRNGGLAPTGATCGGFCGRTPPVAARDRGKEPQPLGVLTRDAGTGGSVGRCPQQTASDERVGDPVHDDTQRVGASLLVVRTLLEHVSDDVSRSTAIEHDDDGRGYFP